MKGFLGVLLLGLVASVPMFAAVQPEQPAKHFHAHVISHIAKYSYKGGKAVVKEAAKPILYAGKQVF
jgi:hypothetical protein